MKKHFQDEHPGTAGAIAAIAFTSIVMLSFIYSIIGIVINDIVDEFSITGTGIGLMGSMMSVGTMLAFLVIPAVQGRVKKIPTLIVACAVQALFLFAGGISPGYAFFCLTCALTGAGCGFIDIYSNSCVVDIRGDKGAKYLGYLHGIFGIGSIVTPPLIYFLLNYTGWRNIYYYVAGTSLFIALAMYVLTRRSDGDMHASTSEQKLRKEELLDYFKQKRNILLSAAAFFSTFVQAGMLAWIMRYMTVQYQAAPLGALCITVYWICATFTRIFLAHIINKAPMKFFLLGGILSGILITAGVLSGSAAVMCVMFGAAGMASGHFIPVLIGENAKGYAGKTTFVTSVLMLVMGVARIITPVLMAYMSASVSMNFSMSVPAVTALITAVFGWFIIREEKKTPGG